MKAEKLLERITLDPDVMTGKPVIKGTRLTVQFILGLLAHGASVEEILERKKQTLTALFKTLLHELMTGQRRVHELEFK